MTTHYQIAPPSEPLEKFAASGRIGLIALATDLTSESDLRHIAPKGVEIFTNRVLNRNPLTVENLRGMAPDITRAAGGILPGESIDVLLYSCTSGTAVIGESEVFRLLRAGQAAHAELPCTTPVTAAMAALECFSARRISILTPYVEAVNRELVALFQQRGIEVINIHGFGIVDDTDMAGVNHDSIAQAAQEACHPDADLLFISCTALRAVQVVERIENEINKPVVTSNQAMMWHALNLLPKKSGQNGASIANTVSGFGRLFAYSVG